MTTMLKVILVLLTFITDMTSADDAYLVVLMESGDMPVLNAASGDIGGWCYVESPSLGWKHSLQAYPYNQYLLSDNSIIATSGIENKSVIVRTRGAVSIYINSGLGLYTPLPISALGTKYTLASCHPSGNYTSVLVIATHSSKTDVDIVFKLRGRVFHGDKAYSDGEKLSVSLGEYQTLTIKSESDLSGTVIISSQTVAVFVGTAGYSLYRNRNHYIIACDQMIPVQQYGNEYVIGVYDPQVAYQLNIISEHNQTQINYNNGSTAFTGNSREFRGYVGQRENLYFATTQPVMVTLCRIAERYSGFVVVPPISFYGKQTALYSSRSYLLKVLCKRTTEVKAETGAGQSANIDWEDIPNSVYKVGSVRRASFITSNDSLAVLVHHDDHVHRAGYTGNYTVEDAPEEEANEVSDDENLALLVVGVVCGCLILALLAVVTALVIYIRKIQSKTAVSARKPNDTDTNTFTNTIDDVSVFGPDIRSTHSVRSNGNVSEHPYVEVLPPSPSQGDHSTDQELLREQQNGSRVTVPGYSSLISNNTNEHTYRKVGETST